MRLAAVTLSSFSSILLLGTVAARPVAAFLPSTNNRGRRPTTGIESELLGQPLSPVDALSIRSNPRRNSWSTTLSGTFFMEGAGVNWNSKTVAELKKELKARGLSMAGKKGDLVDRLNQSDADSVKSAAVEELQMEEQRLVADMRLSNERAREAMKEAGSSIVSGVVEPFMSPEIERGVSVETIQGAVLTVSAVCALITKSIPLAGLAALATGFVAVSPGGLGQLVRSLGNSANRTVDVAKKIDTDGKLRAGAKQVAATSFTKLVEAARKAQEASATAAARAREEAAAKAKAELEGPEVTGETVESPPLDDEPETALADDTAEAAVLEEEAARAVEEAARAIEEVERETEVAVGEEMGDEEWEASIKAAQESIDGTIADWDDEVLNEGDERESWDKAAQLAQELGGEDEDVADDELDLDMLGQAAREAVEAFEQEMEVEKQEKESQRQEWDDSMDGLDEPEDDLEELARAAREAVEMFESSAEPDVPVRQDWNALTVVKLRQELSSRGLPTKGKKSQLVAALEESDSTLQDEDSDDSDFEVDMEDLDMEELGRAAREAAELFNADNEEEPSDEALWEIESTVEYETMTVAQLKDELRSRSLPVSGKKADLISRLQTSD